MARVTLTDYTASLVPAWAGDVLDREHVLPGGAKLDVSQFYAEDSVLVTLTAGAAADATSLAVAALSGAIPNGTLLYFGESKEFAMLTAAAAAGATSLAVQALPSALENADTARYAGSGTKKKVVPNGTVVGRTISERDAGTGYGPAVSSDDEIYILVHDVTDADANNDCDLYRWGSLVKENFLPNWSSLAGALQTAIRAKYQCTKGVN